MEYTMKTIFDLCVDIMNLANNIVEYDHKRMAFLLKKLFDRITERTFAVEENSILHKEYNKHVWGVMNYSFSIGYAVYAEKTLQSEE